MNIESKKLTELEYQLTLTVNSTDYAELEKSKLNKRRKSADLKGFRKGMAPMSLIKKFYGEQVLFESVNEIVSDSLKNYISDNKLNVVGDPLTSDDQPELEWESGKDFVFKFDLGTTSDINIDLTKEDKLPYYKINVTEVAKKEMKQNMLRQIGSLQDAETAKDEDFVIVNFEQDDKKIEKVYVSVDKVEGTAKKKFIGCKVGDSFSIDVNKAFVDDADRAAMLKMSKEEVKDINPKFTVSVVEIKTFVPAEENQDSYDKLFGKDVVKSSEDFDKAIEERLSLNYTEEADYRLSLDIKQYIMDKVNLQLPVEFLKKWLLNINEGKFTKEDIDKEFDGFAKDFSWQLIRAELSKKYSINITNELLQEAAQSYVSYQYAMYGMGNVPETMIKEAASRILSDQKQLRNLYDNVEEKMVIDAIRPEITLQDKKISVDKFRELK